MSVVVSQLQQDIQNELTTSNQLLNIISHEIKQIKELTSCGGQFETKIKDNTALMAKLANIQHIKIENENLEPPTRMEMEPSNVNNHNVSCQEHNTFRNISNMDDSM